MRTYLIILGDITRGMADLNFFKYIEEQKFDYWRYTPFNWILLTPDKISTLELQTQLVKVYGTVFICVLEIDIKDVGGITPMTKADLEKSSQTLPFNWFTLVREKSFVPRWLREGNLN